MSMNQVIDAVVAVASAVSPEGHTREAINQKENSQNLEAILKGILRARDIPLDSKMNDPQRSPTKCKMYGLSRSCIILSNFYPVPYMPQPQ